METCRRLEGLVSYIADKYTSAVEIGIGHFPNVAIALLERGLHIFATDILPFKYKGLKVIVDDVATPNISAYNGVELLYSLRPPPELIPYMERLAMKISADLIVRPLYSEYTGGKLIRHRNTTFLLWNYCSVSVMPLQFCCHPELVSRSNRDAEINSA